MFINHYPVMTLTYFTARSTLVTYAENRKIVIDEKLFWQWAKRQKILEFGKNDHRSYSDPALGLYCIWL